MGRKDSYSGRKGFTLIEAVSTLAILAIIMIAVLVVLNPQKQIMKAKDSQRKTDVKKISKALEDYLNDHPCYPEVGVFLDCGGDGFRPYLSKIPCDPVTKQPYLYQRPECQKFAVFAALITENQTIVYPNTGGYNYVVTSPNYRLVPEELGGVTPTQVPLPTGDGAVKYGCFSGVCQSFSGFDCTPKYLREDCYLRCGSPA
ncbi:hypothetical protein CO053_02130, partial [Candidatus Shapirobacteria bacterium CG_4_9_14_0_2_um_filter_40_11]